LLCGFLLVLGVPALNSVFAIAEGSRIQARAASLGDELVPESEVTARVSALIDQMGDEFEAATLYSDADRFARGRERAMQLESELERWRKLCQEPAIAEISGRVFAFRSASEAAARTSVEAGDVAALLTRGPKLESRSAALEAVEAPREVLRARLSAEIQDVRSTAATSRIASLVALAASTLLALAVAARASRTVTERIARVVAGLRSAVDWGGLRRRLAVEGRDELGELAASFNAFADANQSLLTEIATQVRAGSEAVGQGAARIDAAGKREQGSAEAAARAVDGLTAASRSLRERTQLLAEEMQVAIEGIRGVDHSTAQLLELASVLSDRSSDSALQLRGLTQSIDSAASSLTSMREIARGVEAALANVGQTASDSERNAGETLAFSEAALRAAQEGARSTDASALSMGEIEQRFERIESVVRALASDSQAIEAVVGVIEAIAKSSRMLALNAQILAAQSGPQGRSFGVVAQEMDQLAQRCAGSVQEIGERIARVRQGAQAAVEAVAQGSLRVREGTERSARAGTALREIESRSASAADRVLAIANATRTQALAVRGLETEMRALVQVTAEIEGATQEQLVASALIQRGSDTVSEVAAGVRARSHEQRSGSAEVAKVLDAVETLLQDTLTATRGQDEIACRIEDALEGFRTAATESREAGREMAEVVASVTERAERIERRLLGTASEQAAPAAVRGTPERRDEDRVENAPIA
jgi:methyl-accepting chemotaxis protein